MTDTTKVSETAEPRVAGTAELAAAKARAVLARRRRTTIIVVTIGFILVAALFLFMVTRPPVEDARPTSLGFSFNSFFQWLGDMGPLVQIPIVLSSSARVVGLLLLLIEYAPRPGTVLLLAAARRVLRDPGARLHAAAALPERRPLRARRSR